MRTHCVSHDVSDFLSKLGSQDYKACSMTFELHCLLCLNTFLCSCKLSQHVLCRHSSRDGRSLPALKKKRRSSNRAIYRAHSPWSQGQARPLESMSPLRLICSVSSNSGSSYTKIWLWRRRVFNRKRFTAIQRGRPLQVERTRASVRADTQHAAVFCRVCTRAHEHCPYKHNACI